MQRLASFRRSGPVLALLLVLQGCQGWVERHTPPVFPDRLTANVACPDWRAVRIDHPLDLWLGNPMPSRSTQFGCSVDAALRAQLARPSDLTPEAGNRPVAAAAAAAAGAAVERYRTDKLKPLPRRKSDIGSN